VSVRRSHALLGAVLAVGLLATACTSKSPSSDASATPSWTPSPAPTTLLDRPFAANSPYNTTIPADPAIDPSSRDMISYVTGDGQVYANLREYGVPIWTASPATPHVTVTCRLRWGKCPIATTPIPPGAEPNVGSDGVLVVVDPSDGTTHEFWQARHTGSDWSVSWGAINRLTGSGWGGNATGSGASRLAGIIRVEEVKAGDIPHALSMQSSNACSGTHRAPALKTDGESTRPDCLPEGSRVQLDPSIDLGKVKGMTKAERAVGVALQKYGAYIMDKGAARLSVTFELARDATPRTPGAAYRSAGLRWDYYGMPHIPWDKLRVLTDCHCQT
jgi:hypothetical protein